MAAACYDQRILGGWVIDRTEEVREAKRLAQRPSSFDEMMPSRFVVQPACLFVLVTLTLGLYSLIEIGAQSKLARSLVTEQLC